MFAQKLENTFSFVLQLIWLYALESQRWDALEKSEVGCCCCGWYWLILGPDPEIGHMGVFLSTSLTFVLVLKTRLDHTEEPLSLVSSLS